MAAISSKNNNSGSLKKANKLSLKVHIMPPQKEEKDVRVFSWLTAGLLITISLIIFLMIYV